MGILFFILLVCVGVFGEKGGGGVVNGQAFTYSLIYNYSVLPTKWLI